MKNPTLQKNDHKKENVLIWLIYLLTFVWWLYWGVLEYNDSEGYASMSPSRTWGYPVFIKITTLFGLIHSHFPTLLLALILQFFVVSRFVDFLKQHFNLAKFSVAAMTVIFLLPNFTLFIANNDISECIAYPLFIAALHFLLKSAFEKNEKAAISYFLITALLISVRTQFMFLHLISLLLIVYLLWHSRSKLKSIIRLAGTFAIAILFIAFADRTYHLIMHQRFQPTQFTGQQLIVPALYNIQSGDTSLCKDQMERGLVDTTLTEWKRNPIYNCKFNSVEYSENMVFRYNHLYIIIESRLAYNYLANALSKKGLKPGTFDFSSAIDKITTPLAVKLIKAHRASYARLYFNLVKSALGDWTIMVAFFMLFFLAIIAFFIYGNKATIFLLIACLLMLFNVLLVCTLEQPLIRYMFYTYYLLFAVAFLGIGKLIESGNLAEFKK